MKKPNKTRLIAVTAIFAVAVAVILSVPLLTTAAPAEDPAQLGQALGIISLLPPILAVVLAFLLHDIVVSLAAGLFSGAVLLARIGGGGVGAAFEHSCEGILNTVTNRENAAVILLCLVIGGMVEVIRASGGFEALARSLTKKIDTPKKANLIAEALGVLVFFDDYANALIVGPVLKPVTDKLRISREKLAYLVDSTAAPVTGIAVVSSWVAVEVSVINDGLAEAGVALSGYSVFLQSIPYCFYCIFCLVFIFQSSVMGREFGPMLRAERLARRGIDMTPGYVADEGNDVAPATDKHWQRIVTTILPILILCVTAFVSFYTTGRVAAIEEGLISADAAFSLETVALTFGSADTIYLVMKAAVLGSLSAIFLGSIFGLFSVTDAVQAWLKGASTLLITAVILVLAWTMADIVERLGAVYFVVELISANIAWWLIPALIFLVCCVISFAAGSYGCMFIAMPMAIPIGIAVMGNVSVPNERGFLLACVAAVLSGGIFGDHCSPVTDCTILSSLSSGCNNMEHVRTQMPYAITVAVVSVVCGLLPVALGFPVWLSLLLGCAVMTAILLLWGKSPDNEANK